MQSQLHITAAARPETLERILRVVRHRGFSVVKLTAEQQDGQLQLDFVVESERDISLLQNQLVKLEGVTLR